MDNIARKVDDVAAPFVQHADYASIILPQRVQDRLAVDPLTAELFPTRIGCFPEAHGHGIARSAEAAVDWLVMVCYDGAGRVTAGDRAWDLGAGESCLLPPQLAHAYEADAAAPWSLYWLHLNGTAAADFTRFYGDQPGQARAVDVAAFRREFTPFLDEARRARTLADWRRVANRLRSVLLSVDGRQPRDHGTSALDLRAVHRLMDRELDSQLELDDLARLCGLSRYHFSRRYRAATGESPIDAYIGRKMRLACELLQQPELRVSDVARRVGYSDAHYFSRVFRRTIGHSPRTYRTLAQG